MKNLRISCLVASFFFFAACGAGAPDKPFVFGGEPSPSQSNQCTTDANCTTGQVCSGGTCVLPSPGFCSETLACPTGQKCQNNACIPDAPPAGCNPACTGGKQCVNNVCVDPTPTGCNPACTGGQVCLNNACSACTQDSQCTVAGEKCLEGLCKVPPAGCNPACTGGQVCLNNACSACSEDSQCTTAGEKCLNGLCAVPPLPCTGNDQCADGKACVNSACATCTNNAQCGDGKACEEGACVAALCPDFPCAEGKICKLEDGTCVEAECTGAKLCTDGKVCKSGLCKACAEDMECAAGNVCKAGACTAGCRSDAECGEGKLCNLDPTKKECQATCHLTCTGEGEVLDLTTTPCSCKKTTECQATFAATLALRADSPDDRRDIPGACRFYNLDPTLPGYKPTCTVGPNLKCSADLVCCHEGQPMPGPGLDNVENPISCDAEPMDDHSNGYYLAVTHWKGSAAARIFFKVSPDGKSCRWRMPGLTFPSFKLQNSGLDAALFIDAGGATLRPTEDPQAIRPDLDLAKREAAGDCQVRLDGTGIDLVHDQGADKGLRFRIHFFHNSLQISKQPFFSFVVDATPQIIPAEKLNGVFQEPLRLTTGDAPTRTPTVPPFPDATPPNEIGSLSAKGVPLHFNEATGKSEMTIVASLIVPEEDDPQQGGGLLQQQLPGAPLTASLSGVVAKLDGKPVKTIEDLKNCGDTPNACDNNGTCNEAGGETNANCPADCKCKADNICDEVNGETNANCAADCKCNKNGACDKGAGETFGNCAQDCTILEVSMDATFKSIDFQSNQTVAKEENISFIGTALAGLAGEACTLGVHKNGACEFLALEHLPFAKEKPEDDLLLKSRFTSFDGTLVVKNKASSTIPIKLKVDSKVGPFKITNADSLVGTLNPDDPATTIHIDFQPTTALCPAIADGPLKGYLDCTREFFIDEDQKVKIKLVAIARAPAPEMRLEEISPTGSVSKGLVSLGNQPEINFGETGAGLETKTRLFRIYNNGVRPFQVKSLGQAINHNTSRSNGNLTPLKNFRRVSIYQGANFSRKNDGSKTEWAVNKPFAPVTPDHAKDVFFFVSYGPFNKPTIDKARAADTCLSDPGKEARCDLAHLTIGTQEFGDQKIALKGMATRDLSALLEVFIQDQKRCDAQKKGNNCDDDNEFINDPAVRAKGHFYLMKHNPGQVVDPSKVYDLKQLPTPDIDRQVYLQNGNGDPNDASAVQDRLVVRKFEITGGLMDQPERFKLEAPAAPVTYSLILMPGQGRLLGKLAPENKANSPALPEKYEAGLRFDIVSQAKDVDCSQVDCPGAAVADVFKDKDTPERQSATKDAVFRFKRIFGAPDGMQDLKIHRLLGGYDVQVRSEKLVFTSTTRGIAKRANQDINRFEELYLLKDALELNAAEGTVTLYPIFTDIKNNKNGQPSDNTDKSVRTSDVPGIRLFAGIASKPQREYLFQCGNGDDCAFFFIYMAGWETTKQNCEGKPVISEDPAEKEALDPAVAANKGCFTGDPAKPGSAKPAFGTYDPLTGEITLRDVAIRLYAPKAPQVGANAKIDATLRVDLTTQRVTDGFIADKIGVKTGDADLEQCVPTQTYNTKLFDPPLPLNPLLDYLGDNCKNTDRKFLDGRPYSMPNKPGTLDNEGTAIGKFQYNFDLAAVGKIKATFAVARNMLYFVIKGEIGQQCQNGTFAPTKQECP